MIQSTALKTRLEKIWEKPDFASFFEKYSKRPAIKIKKDSTIFYEGDTPDKVYFVKSGFVKLYRVSENGRDSIIYLYGPGSILGVRALTSQDEILRHNADSLTDVEIITLSREDYFEICTEHPEYLVDLLHIFIDRLNYTERKLEGFVLTDTVARVSNFLADCTRRFGEKNNGTYTLPLPLTHQKIAEFVGSFRETVTVALNKLEDEGIVSIEKGIVTIHDLRKLEDKTSIHDNL